MSKISYLLQSSKKRLLNEGTACPSCSYKYSDTIVTKYVFTSLQRCRNCKLLFRTPTTSTDENRIFYQKAYSQGFTTQMPTVAELEMLKSSDFKLSDKDYTRYIDILSALVRKGASVFDFGCSWGYGSYQIQKAGFQVEAFEISTDRRNYAEKSLGVHTHATLPDVQDKYDIFFSSHVLEHVPSVLDSMEYGFQVLKPGGYFIAFTPNGSEPFRQQKPKEWMKLWNMVHPNFLDDCFYITNSNNNPYFIGSENYFSDTIKDWVFKGHPRTSMDLSGSELMFVAKKTNL